MNLSKDNLVHIHKVLSSDRDECAILAEGATGGRFERLFARREEDNKVLALIEQELGYIPKWEPIPEEEDKKEEVEDE
jgi:hypothetical protein